jgi:hypothetical protein
MCRYNPGIITTPEKAIIDAAAIDDDQNGIFIFGGWLFL